MFIVKKQTCNISDSVETKAGQAFSAYVLACEKHADLELINGPRIQVMSASGTTARDAFNEKKPKLAELEDEVKQMTEEYNVKGVKLEELE